MRIKQGNPYYIEIYEDNGETYYSYSAEILLTPDEAQACGDSDLFGNPDKRIKINKKAWRLAILRDAPDTQEEVNEIISFSNGHKIKLSLLERIILLFTRK